MKYYIYNKLANNGIYPDFLKDVEIIQAVGLDYHKFFDGLKADDEVVFVGGDGTINYFINHTLFIIIICSLTGRLSFLLKNLNLSFVILNLLQSSSLVPYPIR